MKNKEQGPCPEITMVSQYILFRKFRNEPENRTAEKIHQNREHKSDGQVNKPEIIQESHCRPFPVPAPQPHRFRDQHSSINIVDKSREQEHGTKNKKVNICFNITAEIPGNDDGEQE